MKRLSKALVLSLLLGFFLLVISAAATMEPWGASHGYPLHYSYPNLPCTRPNPFNGCGYSYDPVMVGLDFLFWLAIAGAAVSAIDLAWTGTFSRHVRNQTRSSASQSP
ncbi:MAG TPA: hypothetical protein VKA28_00800 [Candidatus Bathyarchaeia archaeon]|nr:hypothetical protein [Candidatus Bathyarchaeia archaeon]